LAEESNEKERRTACISVFALLISSFPAKYLSYQPGFNLPEYNPDSGLRRRAQDTESQILFFAAPASRGRALRVTFSEVM